MAEVDPQGGLSHGVGGGLLLEADDVAVWTEPSLSNTVTIETPVVVSSLQGLVVVSNSCIVVTVVNVSVVVVSIVGCVVNDSVVGGVVTVSVVNLSVVKLSVVVG